MFFKEFKEKNHGKWASIINGLDVDEDLLKEETKSDKQEEIEMLQEFERRRKFKAAFGAIQDTDKDFEFLNKDMKLQTKLLKEKDKSTNLEETLLADKSKGELYDST